MDMFIPFPICLKYVLCVKMIMVYRFLIFPLTIENDEFVLCQNAAFQLRYQNESCSKCHQEKVVKECESVGE